MADTKEGRKPGIFRMSLIGMLFCMIFMLLLTGCGSGVKGTSSEKHEVTTTAGATQAGKEDSSGKTGKTLVVYFSATGTTKRVANIIAEAEQADIYEIVPAEPYTVQDLNYSDKQNRATREQRDKNVRPSIGGEKIDIGKYDTIYIGYPIWWYEEPRIMDTFVEQYDFTGKTLIPFSTSNSAGITRSQNNLEKLAKGGKWLEGRRFSRKASEKEIESWVESL